MVLGGFIGSTSDGVTTTLGRGGSDYSGAIFGAALGVDEIQIWTDVDGMLTADPRIVPQPRLVPQLSFAEASELAYFGAKVLHPSTILPAVARNIPVRILNSRRPDNAGTMITAEARPGEGQLTALACKRDVTVVDITSTRMLGAHGFLRRLFEVFERFKTPVDVVTTSEVSVSVTVDNTRRLDDILSNLRNFAEASCEREMAIICAVGENLRADPTLFGRAVTSLDKIPLRLVSQAASRRNITFVLRDADVPHAMTRLHEQFFQNPDREAIGPIAMRIVLVGHGKMGQLVGELAGQYGCEVAGVIDPGSPLHGGGPDDGKWAGVDVAIDFSTPDSVVANARALAGRGISLVIGTTGWSQHETALRAGRRERRHRRGRGAEFLDRRRAVRGDRGAGGAAVRAAGRLRRVRARVASRGEKRRAVRHGAAAEAGDGAAPAIRGRSTSRPRAPASFPGRTRSASMVLPRRLRSPTRLGIGPPSPAARWPQRNG